MELGPPLHIGVVAIETRAFELPSIKVTNFTLLTINTMTYEY